MRAALVLEDGTVMEGKGFGAETSKEGEVVFCTSMSGYQEALTDPSYAGQLLMLTYPLVGNYGVNPQDYESSRIQVEGFIVREASTHPSHKESRQTLGEFLEHEEIPGIAEVDTRALTLKIREHGVMRGILRTSFGPLDTDELLERVDAVPRIGELDLVSRVTREEVEHHEGRGPRIAVLDLGMKKSILRNLRERGCEVYVLPAKSGADRIMDVDPDGLVISPGPGDPQNVPFDTEDLNELKGRFPIFGICLGHQVMALASGGSTYKLKFGHRGANHPVKDLRTGRVYITSQNHGYAVEGDSIPEDEYVIDKVNLNDDTVEGMRHRELDILTVQYHPEAHPGPQDSEYLFDEFLELVQGD